MARRLPKRDAKGRFVRKSRARRNAPKRKTTTRRRRTYKRNPVKAPDIFVMLKDGSIAATQVLVGKAVVRSVPDLLNLPKQGNVGLAIQAAVALGTGYLSSMFLSRGAAAAMMAGGLTAPIETLLVSNNVPWIGEALSPTSDAAAVSGYMGRYPQAPGMGRYPRPVAALAGYPTNQIERGGFTYSAHDDHAAVF